LKESEQCDTLSYILFYEVKCICGKTVKLYVGDLAMKAFRFGIPAYDALYCMEEIGNALMRFVEPLCRNMGLTVTQYRVLFLIRYMGRSIKVSEMAQLTDRRTHSMTTVIDRMEKAGLVERLRDNQDRRSINLVITEEGNKKLEATTGPFLKLLTQLASCCSEEELQLFLTLIEKLRNKVLDMTTPGETIEEVYAEDISDLLRLINRPSTVKNREH